MKIRITESQYNNFIERSLEEEYPVNWSVDDFKKLRSFNARIKYCEKNLIRISSGSSRIVYKIDDTKVLKLAKNRKGIAQNEVEISYSNDYYLKNIIAEVIEYDENDLWVEMELARKVTPVFFKNIVGVSFDEYCNVMRYQHSETFGRRSYISHSKPENMDEMWENEFVSNMIDAMINYEMPVGDLCKLSTYGLVKRDGYEKIVLIDYGLTNNVYDSYYK